MTVSPSPAELELEPAEAVTVFGDRLSIVRHFTNQLALHGEERGLIGPLELLVSGRGTF